MVQLFRYFFIIINRVSSCYSCFKFNGSWSVIAAFGSSLHYNNKIWMFLRRYCMEFCWISKFIHPRWVILNDTRQIWIVSYRWWINLMLNKHLCNVCFITYFSLRKETKLNSVSSIQISNFYIFSNVLP